jgi:poly(3-hydroxybutyrate) depolymerase
MRSFALAFLALGALGLASARRADPSQTDAPSEITRRAAGSFRFTDPGTTHPITVWFCRPSTIAPDTRVVFVMHGSESKTARQACEIALPYVQTHNAIVIAPQFAEEYFPDDAYMFGDMVDATGKLRAKTAWALTTIERLFDRVRDEAGLTRTEYDIVGFSGGAQFVHRLVLFVPEARFRRAVVASAGRYALPSFAARFPYGLAGSPIDRSVLAQVFSRDVIVLLGDRDVVDRERDAASMAQGTTRFARGLRFFAVALDEAAGLGIEFRWQLRIAHGVDHSPIPMVRAALEALEQ